MAYIVFILDAVGRFLLLFSSSTTDVKNEVYCHLQRAALALPGNYVEDVTYDFTRLLQLYDAQFVNDVVVHSDVVARTAAFRIAFDQAVEAMLTLQALRTPAGGDISIPSEMGAISGLTSIGGTDTSIVLSMAPALDGNSIGTFPIGGTVASIASSMDHHTLSTASSTTLAGSGAPVPSNVSQGM
jgi:hypothetical protein